MGGHQGRALFFDHSIMRPELTFYIILFLRFVSYLASGFLLIPRPEAEITKCLSRRGRQIRGYPDWLILGGCENRHFWGTPRFRGVGVEGSKSPY